MSVLVGHANFISLESSVPLAMYCIKDFQFWSLIQNFRLPPIDL